MALLGIICYNLQHKWCLRGGVGQWRSGAVAQFLSVGGGEFFLVSWDCLLRTLFGRSPPTELPR
ncbi:hypothetical protein [Microcoleus sp. Pol10D4]|uniref:hypothetical protein n=1 Tax=Microcoleus sp. Pol10D4 TaxID=3055387 RepID=UPI002FD52DAA